MANWLDEQDTQDLLDAYKVDNVDELKDKIKEEQQQAQDTQDTNALADATKNVKSSLDNAVLDASPVEINKPLEGYSGETIKAPPASFNERMKETGLIRAALGMGGEKINSERQTLATLLQSASPEVRKQLELPDVAVNKLLEVSDRPIQDLSKWLSIKNAVQVTGENAKLSQAKTRLAIQKTEDEQMPFRNIDTANIVPPSPQAPYGVAKNKEMFLAQLPTTYAAIVPGLADYTLDPSKVTSMRTDQRQKIIAATKMYDPSFDMKEYPRRANYVKDLSDTGPSSTGGKVLSINTLVQHLQTLKKEVVDLHNTGGPASNAVVNFAKTQFGLPSTTNYDTAKNVVDDEMERLITGAAVTQEGKKAMAKIINKNSSYEQQMDGIGVLEDIMLGRGRALESQYRQIMKKDPGNEIFYKETMDLLNQQHNDRMSKIGAMTPEQKSARIAELRAKMRK